MINEISLIFMGMMITLTSVGQISINADGSSPHPSAGLDVDFADKGILIPRISSLGLIDEPAHGLLVFLTSDNSFYYNHGIPELPIWSRLFHSPSETELDMSGNSIVGVANPTNGADAVNKDYVDNAIAASGGGGPTMVSKESLSTAANFGDAVRYCQDLSEDSHTDWYLPTFQQLITVISKGGSTVDTRTSSNFIWTAFSDAYDGSNAQYRYMAYRMSDGFGRRNWSTTASFVRCVR